MKRIDPNLILKTVYDYYHLPVEHVIFISQKGDLVKARQTAMHFMKIYSKLSLHNIGKYFMGRSGYKDHASVLHNIATAKNDMETCKTYQRDIEVIEKTLQSMREDIVTKEQVYIMRLVKTNKAQESEIARLNNKISLLESVIYGMKLNIISKKKQLIPLEK